MKRVTIHVLDAVGTVVDQDGLASKAAVNRLVSQLSLNGSNCAQLSTIHTGLCRKYKWPLLGLARNVEISITYIIGETSLYGFSTKGVAGAGRHPPC